ncbi:MAG: hypothetical protein U0992_22315 [Planctomycetaceae bacterium]
MRSFERGARYFRSGRIHEARRAGNVLKARCFGSDEHDYRVEVRLNGSKIVSGRCSCPVGATGVCKHIAALLLNWREQPADFEEAPAIESVLAQRTPVELVALIHTLLEAEPALEDVLEAALPIAARTPEQTFESVHRTIVHALERLAEGGEPGPAAAAITAQCGQIESRRAVGDFATAAAIGRGVISATIEKYEVNADMTGSVAEAVNHVAGALIRCFAGLTEHDSLRRTILHELLTLLRFDVCSAGAGLAESVSDAIARQVTPDERQEVVAWVRENSPPARAGDPVDAWQRECWGALIADLIGDELSNDAYLEHCREFGLDAALIARLLQLQRFDEALEAAASLEEPQLPEIAELFLKHGRDADAVRLMQCRAADSPAAATWLTDYYEDRGAWDDALEWRRHEFEQSPDLVNYRAVRRAAQKADRWPELADELLDVAGRAANPEERLRILIEECREAELLREVKAAQASGRRFSDRLLEDVAARLEKRHPEEAIDLYLQVSERLIASRRAGNYVAAAELLCRARRLYQSTGREQEWNQRIKDIASRHSRRRAFWQQLRRDQLLP